ncbi:hypothetical protein ACRRTK_023252 [Alexandromys fortis]
MTAVPLISMSPIDLTKLVFVNLCLVPLLCSPFLPPSLKTKPYAFCSCQGAICL